ncbi:serologically defined colon cancer antigen 8 homolog isoform X1 [Electrophorus electricus]|uniref:serologically defined colon cancer antigen 8 homolog isoform X1 n=1 Tax=Electrophorus electricus TaxID=8005 RepID=UPI0015D01ACB|nr:serologically defined colon cancer antigen 8 homolog isoform X1 [Electrophorus electricus]XP_035387731.1 serologically defined colon cancer antigen 8 homolog isoform X1 [Electrophorus electricus]
MKPSMDLDEEEELGLYQKKLRERANRSIQQLSSMLANHSSDAEALEQGSSPSCQSEGPWPSVQQSEAVSQLRSLLQQRPREAQVQSLSPSKRKSSPKRHTDEDSSSLPAVQDLVPIIHNQSEYIQHLEAEVKFCKEELLVMKQRVRVVVVENEKLHEELKAKMVEDTLKEYTLVDSTVNEETTVDKITSTPTPKPRQSFIHQNEDKWEKELEQLKCLYQAQTETLEAQVVSLKKDLVSCQKECEEVKQRLRHKEALAAMVGSGQRVGGLCVKCAQHEAVLAETHSNVHVQAIERLTKERDELMTVLCSLRAAQSEAQQREWSAYQQVKQAVEMSEEANLEKTKALVQCEHIQAELARQRERLEKTLASEQEKISQARTIAQAEGKREKEKLAQAVSSLTQRAAELEGLVGRGERERNSLNTQLEEAFRKLTSQEADSSKVCGELRYQLSQAQLKREEAEREARDSSAKLGRRLELTEQEVQKLGAELSGSRQRLEEAQRAEGRARAEAAGLAEGLSRAQRQLHLTRQEKETAERRCAEDTAALTFQAQRRERELTQTLGQMEAQHEQSVAETDALLSSQKGLIGKLKEECRCLGSELEELTLANRVEVEQLSLEKQHLQDSVEKLQGRCQEMEEQCVQHGRMHQRMKHRLQQLDQQCQSSAQQVVALLSRQNQLVQDRQILSQEMQNLHVQLPLEKKDDLLTL